MKGPGVFKALTFVQAVFSTERSTRQPSLPASWTIDPPGRSSGVADRDTAGNRRDAAIAMAIETALLPEMNLTSDPLSDRRSA
jgi:hypothetical protein